MECTFRRKDILALLESHPEDKNMIVKFDLSGKKPFTARMQKRNAEETDEIDGCPFPPGCTPEED